MRRMSKVLVGAAGGLGMLATAFPTTGQEQPSAFPGVFSEVLDVRVINLEVTVTDKDGTPILGLGPGDFRLLVGGEEVEVEYFSEVRGGLAVSDGPSGDLPAAPDVTPGERVGTSYLVFIDEYFSIKRDRDRVLGAIADEAARLLPEDRMAVVAYDGKKLDMLTTWTGSYPTLERVLAAARDRPAHGLERLVEKRQFEATLGARFDSLLSGFGGEYEFPARPSFSRTLEPWEQAYVSRLTEQVNRVVAAATATLRSFAKPPGRKVLILLSGGWPFIPADYAVNDLTRMLLDRGGPYGSTLFSRLSETANLLGYTIYSVDVPGLTLDSGGAAERQLPDLRPGVGQDFMRERELQDSLRFLARETGGKALVNAQRLEVMPTVIADTRSYYWLGFSPLRERDDQRHDVTVKLANPEFRARVRSGFLDSSRETEVTMAVESSLLFGSAAASETLQVELEAPRPVGSRQMEMPITVRFDLGAVTFLPRGEKFVAELELRVAVLDAEGRQAPIPVVPLRLALDEIPAGGELGRYDTKLLLRRLPHQAVVAVHDVVSGRILTAGVQIEP